MFPKVFASPEREKSQNNRGMQTVRIPSREHAPPQQEAEEKKES